MRKVVEDLSQKENRRLRTVGPFACICSVAMLDHEPITVAVLKGHTIVL